MSDQHRQSRRPPPTRAGARPGRTVALTRRRWLIRGGAALVITAMVVAALGGAAPLTGRLGHWSTQLAFVALLVGLGSGGEWLIGRGYRHRADAHAGDQRTESA